MQNPEFPEFMAENDGYYYWDHGYSEWLCEHFYENLQYVHYLLNKPKPDISQEYISQNVDKLTELFPYFFEHLEYHYSGSGMDDKTLYHYEKGLYINKKIQPIFNTYLEKKVLYDDRNEYYLKNILKDYTGVSEFEEYL